MMNELFVPLVWTMSGLVTQKANLKPLGWLGYPFRAHQYPFQTIFELLAGVKLPVLGSIPIVKEFSNIPVLFGLFMAGVGQTGDLLTSPDPLIQSVYLGPLFAALGASLARNVFKNDAKPRDRISSRTYYT